MPPAWITIDQAKALIVAHGITTVHTGTVSLDIQLGNGGTVTFTPGRGGNPDAWRYIQPPEGEAQRCARNRGG